MKIWLCILTLINCFINAFAKQSKGLVFVNKKAWQGLHVLVLLIIMIVSLIKFGLLEALLILLIDFSFSAVFAVILNKLFFK